MLRFFRKLREDLIMTNKTRKYILYAMGEVALVMIGILLALQVNNWHQQTLDQQKETRYLYSLIRDLEAQIAQIDNKIEREHQSKLQMQDLMDEYRQTQRFDFSRQNVIKFNALLDRATYVVNKPTFTELLSTGNLEVISDESLRNKIVDYYQKMELSELIILKNNDLKDNTIQPSALRLIEFSPTAVLYGDNENDQSNEEDMQTGNYVFPSMQRVAESINELKENRFELLNLLKMRWLISEASINFLKEDRSRTEVLIKHINQNITKN